MRILVTGGLGFIGSNFCSHMFKKYSNYQLINIDKIGIGANPKNLRNLEKESRYTFIRGNICDSSLTSTLVKDVDAIVNIASETHVDRSIRDPVLFFENNTKGTLTLLEAVRKYNNNATFTQVSTDEVYGEAIEGAFTEKDMSKPSNPYSASKAAADMFVMAYHKTYSLKTNITRCTNNYGPYQFPEKFIPKIIIRALKNLQIPLYGSGENIRDWLYVKDHCQAIDLVLSKGQPGEIYNISAGNELSNMQVAKKTLALMDKPESLVTFVEDRPGHDLRYSLDSKKIRSELDWKPKFQFEKGLKATVDWYINSRWWWKQLATEENLHPTPWKLSDTT
ncbi:MAG: dTDP-glucose 4,6-dehydratase [Candidatus Bathyarchaeota archaeon]|nr:dTDP-glucose 4,6-dehydratase [Candidatus Bathyarchaeota archaeon]